LRSKWFSCSRVSASFGVEVGRLAMTVLYYQVRHLFALLILGTCMAGQLLLFPDGELQEFLRRLRTN
jgi:hypothetical protein